MKPRDNSEKTYWYQLRISPFNDGNWKDGLKVHTKDKKKRKRRFYKSMRRYDKRIIEEENYYEEDLVPN